MLLNINLIAIYLVDKLDTKQQGFTELYSSKLSGYSNRIITGATRYVHKQLWKTALLWIM